MSIPKDILSKVAANDPSLQAIDFNQICHGQIDDADIEAFANAMKRNTYLKEVKIRGNYQLSQYMESFLHGRLSNNSIITTKSAEILARLPIEKLDISHNDIGDKGLIALSKSQSLKKLRVDSCNASLIGKYAFLQNVNIVDISALNNIADMVNNAQEIKNIFILCYPDFSVETLEQALNGDNAALRIVFEYLNRVDDAGFVIENIFRVEQDEPGEGGCINPLFVSHLDGCWEKMIEKTLSRNKFRYCPVLRDQETARNIKSKLETNIKKLIKNEPLDTEKLHSLILQLDQRYNSWLEEYNSSILSFAVDNNKPKAVEFLLQHGALIERHDREYTPLFDAAEKGFEQVVHVLLKYGSNMTGEFHFNKETALSISAFKFCESLVFLIKIILNIPNLHFYLDDTALRSMQYVLEIWNMISRESCIPIWQCFTDPQLIEYALNNLRQLNLINRFQFVAEYLNVQKKSAVTTMNYANIFKAIHAKKTVLEQKPPSIHEDELASDEESDIEIPRRIYFDEECDSRKSNSNGVRTNEYCNLTREQLEIYIQRLNQELKEYTEEEINWDMYPKFFVAQYRGIHYYRNHFTKDQRADHRRTYHLNRIAPAPAVYKMSSLTPIQHQLARESVVKSNSDEVRDTFDHFSRSLETTAYWGKRKQTFANESEMMQQRMSNSYLSYRTDIEKHKQPVTKILFDKNIIGYPHYATSDLPYHSLNYAYGQKRVNGLTEWRLLPGFQKDGSRLHPYPGKIFISMFSPLALARHKARCVAGMHNRKDIRLLGTVAPEREKSIPGSVDELTNFYEELLTIPSIEMYKSSYEERFGINRALFGEYKEMIEKSFDSSSSLEAQTKNRENVKNRLIQKLILLKSKQLLRVAQNEATRRGGYLIYKNYDGNYSLDPEIIRIPSRSKDYLPSYEKELLEVGKERFITNTIDKGSKIPAGLNFLEIPLDGHCFFNAVALYLNKDVETLRSETVQYIRAHQSEFEFFFGSTITRSFDEHLALMEHGNEWADHLEIQALSRSLQRLIIIYQSNGSVTKIGNDEYEPIFVYYNGSTHYSGLVLTGERSANDILRDITNNQLIINHITKSPTILYDHDFLNKFITIKHTKLDMNAIDREFIRLEKEKKEELASCRSDDDTIKNTIEEKYLSERFSLLNKVIQVAKDIKDINWVNYIYKPQSTEIVSSESSERAQEILEDFNYGTILNRCVSEEWGMFFEGVEQIIDACQELEIKVDCDQHDFNTGDTILIEVIRAKEYQLAHKLLDMGADPKLNNNGSVRFKHRIISPFQQTIESFNVFILYPKLCTQENRQLLSSLFDRLVEVIDVAIINEISFSIQEVLRRLIEENMKIGPENMQLNRRHAQDISRKILEKFKNHGLDQNLKEFLVSLVGEPVRRDEERPIESRGVRLASTALDSRPATRQRRERKDHQNVSPLLSSNSAAAFSGRNVESRNQAYDDERVYKLIEKFFGLKEGVKIYAPLSSEAFQTQLEEFEQARMSAIAGNQRVEDRVIIPINTRVGEYSHWSLLELKYFDDAVRAPHVNFYDPAGGILPDAFRCVLELRHPSIQINQLINSNVQQSRESCGVYIVEIARRLAEDQTINDIKTWEEKQLRTLQGQFYQTLVRGNSNSL